MKKINLFAAMALPIAFAACSNEDLTSEVATQEVVGAKLAATSVTLTPAEAASRLTSAGWAEGERLGVAWFDITGTSISTSQITGNATEGYNPATATTYTDYKLYANHMFEYANGAFGYYGDVYEGAYFAYFPFEKQKTIGDKTVTLAQIQDVDDADKSFYLNNAFSISAKDYIVAKADGSGVNKSFDLVKVTNAFNVTTSFDGSEDVADLYVESVEISVDDNNSIFSTKAKIQPQYLPTAVYSNGKFWSGNYVSTTATGTGTKDLMTLTNLFPADKAPIAIDADSQAKKIATATITYDITHDNASTCHVAMPIKNANSVTLLTFPTTAPDEALDASKITVKVKAAKKVGDKYVADGTFTITASDPSNTATLAKIATYLNTGKNVTNANGQFVSMQNLMTSRVSAPIVLKMSSYEQTSGFEVKSAEEWNAAVTKINAMGTTAANITIKPSNNLAFTATAPALFPTKAILTVTDNSNSFTLNGGASTVAKNVTGLTKITVKSGATLTVAQGATVAAVDNEGTLNVNGTVTTAGNLKVGTYAAGVVNLGAKGVITTLTNASTVNVAEGTTNEIGGTATNTGDIIATLSSAANDATVRHLLDGDLKKVQATKVIFNGATIKAQTLIAAKTYVSTGATTIKGACTGSNSDITVESGTLTFAKNGTPNDTKISLGTVTVKAGATLIDATENAGVTISKVDNSGSVVVKAKTTLKVTTTINGNISTEGTGSDKGVVQKGA